MATTPKTPQDNLPEDFIQKLGEVKQSLQLSTDEAQSMRERLVAYADMHAASAPAARRSPYSFHLSSRIFYSRAFIAGVLIFVLVIGTGTGVTYAAGNSLPGQPLYQVKVNVSEPIEGAVIAATSGTAGTADWQNTLAERRLTEASTLAAENKLASSTQTYLENQVALHVAQSNDDSAKLAAAGDTQAATTVRTNLEARLAAHAELLALIAPRLAAAGYATTTSQVAMLLNDVSQDQMAVLFNRGGEGEAGIHAVDASTTISSSSSASTTEATTTVTVAVATPSSSSSFKSQEARFFALDAHILSLLPQASTTASTSPFKDPRKHPHDQTDASSTDSTTITVTSTTTTTTDSTSGSPASDNSEATSTVQIDL